jgi:group I intron endonuclease
MVVYLITNTVNGMQYVGQTTRSLAVRWKAHRKPGSACTLLRRAIAKYGKHSFKIETLAICSTLSELNEKEVNYIKHFNTLSPNGYNLTTGGNNTFHSDAAKSAMRKARQRQVPPMSGKTHSAETRAKMTAAKLGRIASNETRQGCRPRDAANRCPIRTNALFH